MAENIITQKVGPLPLVVWVAIGSGGVLLLLMLTHKSSGAQSTQTNSVNALSPTEAESFGTIEQQQQDVVNALSTLAQNQSALGGSISTLNGSETQNWANANQQFGNILSGLSTVQSGQQDAASAAQNYFQTLNGNIAAYGSQIYNQQAADYQSLYNQGQGNFTELAGIMTDPWVKQFYENQIIQNLQKNPPNPAYGSSYQNWYWDAMKQAGLGGPTVWQQQSGLGYSS
jgi:hypothetical protein